MLLRDGPQEQVELALFLAFGHLVTALWTWPGVSPQLFSILPLGPFAISAAP